ncbi:hypothetical protein [Elstera litoralis]|nr:hypothetical protein [Elstera litoralis]
MTAARTRAEVKRVRAAAGDAALPPDVQMARRNIQVVTELERAVDPETGKPVRVPGRTGLKVVSKIDHLYARQLVSERQYQAALEVLGWMQQAQLSAPSALSLMTQSGGAGGLDGWTVARLDALSRLRHLRQDIGTPGMGLLVYVLLDEGDLGDWPGLADSTAQRRKDYRGSAALALLLIVLDRLVIGA